MLTIFSITTANPIWDIARRREIPECALDRRHPFLLSAHYLCSMQLGLSIFLQNSLQLTQSLAGVRWLKQWKTHSQAVPKTCFLPCSAWAGSQPAQFHSPRAGVTRTFRLQGRYFAHSFVFEVKILKEIPIKVDIRTVLSESKMWCYQQTIYYISEL